MFTYGFQYGQILDCYGLQDIENAIVVFYQTAFKEILKLRFSVGDNDKAEFSMIEQWLTSPAADSRAFMKGWKQNENVDFDFYDAHDLRLLTDRASEDNGETEPTLSDLGY